jgi:hypothetical protein
MTLTKGFGSKTVDGPAWQKRWHVFKQNSMEGLAEEMQFQAEETLAMLRTKMSCCKQKGVQGDMLKRTGST